MDAGRDVLLQSGSQVLATQATAADGQSGGDIVITAGRNITQDQGSTISVNATKPAGSIQILAPNGRSSSTAPSRPTAPRPAPAGWVAAARSPWSPVVRSTWAAS